MGFDETIYGDDGPNRLIGNYGNSLIWGRGGDDYINGGRGVDYMSGGRGNDTYVVDNASDTVKENSGEGTDTIKSSVSYTASNNVENLTLTGWGFINGTGNASQNILRGNSRSNTLNGGRGADFLYGGAGNDFLNGGAGIDTMKGGPGNDTYIVNSIGDKVSEDFSFWGTDIVESSISYAIKDKNVENLTLTGSSNINGTGNASANTIRGNGGANRLIGDAGADKIFGDAGADTLFGDAGNDILNGGSGIDDLRGGAGNDILNGGNGIDDMHGGAGNDTYIVDRTGDIVREYSNQGTDLVKSSATYILESNNVENLTLTGASNINGTGNSSANTIRGNGGANRLIGDAGADTLFGDAGNDILNGGNGIDDMHGGTGNDTYFVDNSSDVITEAFNEGTDLVNSSVSYTIKNNIENLTLTGSEDIDGTGNTSANTIKGNSGANTLVGGAGADNLFGNAGNDSLNGWSGNDILNGGLGDDRLVGGAGIDTVVFSARNNRINLGSTRRQNTGDGNDILIGIENVNGGASNDIITGNRSANILHGENGNDTLEGGLGNDRLVGGFGNDRLFGGGGNDTLNGGKGNDRLVGFLGNDIFQINSGVGRDLIVDYEDGGDRIKLLGGLTKDDLTFSSMNSDINGLVHTKINYGNDLLAIVEYTFANDITFI